MKHLIKPLLTALLLLCSAVINAHGFRVDWFYYNILSEEDKTVEVTSASYAYTGAVTIPASVTYNSTTYGVTSIGDWAFYNCTGLTSIEIPSSVTSIGRLAFSGCTGLTSIEIPSSVTSIGQSAFEYCTSLTSVVIPEGVTSIGDYAFCGCDGLTSIEIPSSVTSIGNCAFYNCYGLTSVEISEGVTSIGEEAFYSCIGLTSIEIPEGVTSIGNYAFYNCVGLTSIEIPSSVTSIGNCAFYRCIGLTSVVIPEGVTSIGNSAFSICTGLTSIEIPAGVTSIGEEAFYYCTGLTSIVVDEGNTIYDSRNNCNAIIETASNTLIAGCVNTIIPSGVTSIGNNAFNGFTGLTSIEIPSSVTSIGQSAFEYCTSLTSIEIPSSVTSIGDEAFAYCRSLTSIVVYEGNTVYDSRNNCNAIIENASNTLIAGCKNTIIPEGVTSIGMGAFEGCTGLTSIEIPSSVTSIGDDAFLSCDGLTSIEIPSSVTSIGDYAFTNCTGLTSIEIPSSVTSIGRLAFSCCSGLTSIVSHIAAEDLFAPGDYAFDVIDKDACTLFVPAGAKSTYAATDGWKDFKNIVEFKSRYTITYKVDGEVYATDSINYGAIITPVETPTKEGYTFSGWSEIPETMPAKDVVVEGTFSINSYTVSFMVDGEVYKSLTVKYGDSIPAVEVPTLDGYIFDSWDEIPSIMPAEDIIIESYWLIPGDVNNDGRISVLDITILTNHILRINDNSIFKQQAADMNSDGRISIVDVTKVTNKILE